MLRPQTDAAVSKLLKAGWIEAETRLLEGGGTMTFFSRRGVWLTVYEHRAGAKSLRGFQVFREVFVK